MQLLSDRQKQVHERAISIGVEFIAREKELIEVFIEVEAHEVFRAVGCSSLYEYALKHLHLTPDQAYTYSKIAQASRKSAELREAVQEKEINITNARLVATLFSNSQVKLDREKKSEILQKAKECSVRELRRGLAEEFPQAGLREEKVREVAGNRVRLEFSVEVDAMERFRRVQDLESNKKRRNVSVEEAFNEAILFYLEKCDPVEKAKRAEGRKSRRSASTTVAGDSATAVGETVVTKPVAMDAESVEIQDEVVSEREAGREMSTAEATVVAKREPVVSKRPGRRAPSIISITPNGAHEFKAPPERVKIPARVKAQVLLRDGGSCQHVMEDSRGKCGVRRFVEVHHRVPVEKGGANLVENLITLCHAHHSLVHFQDTG